MCRAGPGAPARTSRTSAASAVSVQLSWAASSEATRASSASPVSSVAIAPFRASSRQGLGLGSLLLRAVLSRVDQDRVECQLFTDQPRNVPLYQRSGFEIAVDGDLPGAGPHFWFMRRRPQALTA